MSKGKQPGQKAVDFDALDQISLNAAGIDIGAAEIFVASDDELDRIVPPLEVLLP